MLFKQLIDDIKEYPFPTSFSNKKHSIEYLDASFKYGNRTIWGQFVKPGNINTGLPVIIGVHGFNGSHRMFKKFYLKSLAKSGYCGYYFDFISGSDHSLSGGGVYNMSIMDEVEQLLAIIEYVKKQSFIDPNNIILLGESQGSVVSALAAVKNSSDIKAMTLLYPAFSLITDMQAEYTDYEEIPRCFDLLDIRLSKNYYRDLIDIDVYNYISQYDKDVLIIHGKADSLINIECGLKANEVYKNSQFIGLDKQDHGFWAKGKLIAGKEIYRFLEKVVK